MNKSRKKFLKKDGLINFFFFFHQRMPSGSFSQSMLPEATQLHSGRLRGLPGLWAGRRHGRLTAGAAVRAGPPQSWAFRRVTNTETMPLSSLFLWVRILSLFMNIYVLTLNGFMIIIIK